MRTRKLVERLGIAGFESRLVRAALGCRDIVDKTEHALGVILGVYDRKHHLEVVRLLLDIYRVGIERRLSSFGDVAEYKVAQSALKMIFYRKRTSALGNRAQIRDRNGQIAVEIRKLAASSGNYFK